MDDLIRALPNLLKAAGDSEEVAEVAAFVAWRRVAGEQLGGQAVPFRLHRKMLVVAVPDTSWQKQLEAVANQFIFRLNSVLGHAVVTYIEFRVDQKTVREERERLRQMDFDHEQHERRALARARALSADATAIKDETLRRHFLLAAGSYMEAQKKRSD